MDENTKHKLSDASETLGLAAKAVFEAHATLNSIYYDEYSSGLQLLFQGITAIRNQVIADIPKGEDIS